MSCEELVFDIVNMRAGPWEKGVMSFFQIWLLPILTALTCTLRSTAKKTEWKIPAFGEVSVVQRNHKLHKIDRWPYFKSLYPKTGYTTLSPFSPGPAHMRSNRQSWAFTSSLIRFLGSFGFSISHSFLMSLFKMKISVQNVLKGNIQIFSPMKISSYIEGRKPDQFCPNRPRVYTADVNRMSILYPSG